VLLMRPWSDRPVRLRCRARAPDVESATGIKNIRKRKGTADVNRPWTGGNDMRSSRKRPPICRRRSL
jgi:hypothetical protein